MQDDELTSLLDDFELADSPGHLLRRNQQRALDIFTRIVGGALTRQQAALLIALVKAPGASQNELVAATGIDKSTLKEMIGRMVAKDWVSRERDQSDSRAWTMHITPSGKEIILAHIAGLMVVEKEILAPLPKEERARFVRSLRKLIDL